MDAFRYLGAAGLDRARAWLCGYAEPDKPADESPPAREQLEQAVDECIRRMGLALDTRDTCASLTRELSPIRGVIDFRHLAGDAVFLLADPQVIAALHRTSVELLGEPGLHTVALPDAIPQRLVGAILEALKQIPGLEHLEVEKLYDVLEMHGTVWVLKNHIESVRTVAPRELAGDGSREPLVLHRDHFSPVAGAFDVPVKRRKPLPLSTGVPAADALMAKSPTLLKDSKTLKRKGWKLNIGRAGDGSWASRGEKTIVLDAGGLHPPERAVRALAHETGHALYPYRADRFSKGTYVAAALADEGAAVMHNIMIQREIMAEGGPDIGVSSKPANARAYNQAYDRFLVDGDASAARRAIGAVVAKGEIAGGTNQSYADYYGDGYDRTSIWSYLIRPKKTP